MKLSKIFIFLWICILNSHVIMKYRHHFCCFNNIRQYMNSEQLWLDWIHQRLLINKLINSIENFLWYSGNLFIIIISLLDMQLRYLFSVTDQIYFCYYRHSYFLKCHLALLKFYFLTLVNNKLLKMFRLDLTNKI